MDKRIFSQRMINLLNNYVEFKEELRLHIFNITNLATRDISQQYWRFTREEFSKHVEDIREQADALSMKRGILQDIAISIYAVSSIEEMARVGLQPIAYLWDYMNAVEHGKHLYEVMKRPMQPELEREYKRARLERLDRPDARVEDIIWKMDEWVRRHDALRKRLGLPDVSEDPLRKQLKIEENEEGSENREWQVAPRKRSESPQTPRTVKAEAFEDDHHLISQETLKLWDEEEKKDEEEMGEWPGSPAYRSAAEDEDVIDEVLYSSGSHENPIFEDKNEKQLPSTVRDSESSIEYDRDGDEFEWRNHSNSK